MFYNNNPGRGSNHCRICLYNNCFEESDNKVTIIEKENNIMQKHFKTWIIPLEPNHSQLYKKDWKRNYVFFISMLNMLKGLKIVLH